MTHHTRLMTRRQLLTTTAALAGLAPASAAPRTPNVVVILADDQGWGDLSIHGNSNLSTPNIDSIGRDGVLFDRFFACSVCAPTRAEFLTGRYHPRCGVRGVTTGAERLNLDESTIAQTFRQSGYATGAFGKWHNGSQAPYHPNSRGFDEYYGFTSGHWAHYFDTDMDHNGSLTRGRGYITDDLTDHALQFIRQNRRRPFFCYLPIPTPHSPMQVPDRFYERFANFNPKLTNRDPSREELPMTRAALAMCENIDWNVGRVLSEIDRAGLRNDTIVVYFSDNGPNSWRWNGGMKGRKGTLDEGGLRVPMLMRWPGRIPAGRRIPQIASAIDLRPTLSGLAGIPVAGNKPLDGLNLQPLLTGAATGWPDRLIFSMHSRRASVRSQRYRVDPTGALFDMHEDPGQDRNVAATRPEEAARLEKARKDWETEMLPMVGPDDRPFSAGYSRVTMLPARDAVAEGGIKRSSIHPNSTFFTNWTSKDDRISWDIEIGQPGLFEAVVYYTCPPAQTGSTIELSFNGAAVSAKVAPAHNPPLTGEAEDRVKRTEGYFKRFRPLKLGNLSLAQGRGKLTLRALDIAAKEVADIRYVALTRK
jgi:arylsulfatase A-like enzyme